MKSARKQLTRRSMTDGSARLCRSTARGLRGRLGSDHAADVDEVVGDDPETDPAPHSVVAAVSAPIEAVTTLADTDATFASRYAIAGRCGTIASSARAGGQRFWWNDWVCRPA